MPQIPKKNPRISPKNNANLNRAKRRAAAKKGGKIRNVISFETPKQLIADPRAGKAAETDRIDLTTQIASLVEPITVEQYLIEDYARGFVMKAMEKGFASFAELPNQPYFAYVYIVNLMKSLIVNQTQLVASVPQCILEMCRALSPKTVPFSNGSVTYTVVCPDAAQPTPTKVLGYTPFGEQWSLCPVTHSTIVNGLFPILETTVPGYTDALGAQAYQRLCQLLANDDPDGPARMVPVYKATALDRDCSAFAYHRQSLETIGLSSQGAGSTGAVATMNLEVPIFRPQFSAFNSVTFTPATAQRFGNLHANVCGDGTFLAAAQMTWFTPDIYKMQRPPKLHYVDFLEFGDTVAKTLCLMQQAAINDPANAGVNPDLYTCSLTLQEMLIILRNLIMTAFKDTQAGVHCIYPAIPESDESNAFVPYMVSANTCFLSQNSMRLPAPLIENIRALVSRFVERKGEDIEYFIPVLGQKKYDQLSEDDYFFTVGEQSIPTFKSSAIIAHKKESSKAGTILRPLAETSISLIDGSSSAGLVCINDPEALTNLTTAWEEWLESSGVAAYCLDLAHLGTEKGITLCASVMLDRFIGTQEVDRFSAEVAKRTKALSDIVPVSAPLIKQKSLPPSNVYTGEDRGVSIDMSQSKILATAYEQILSVWILPTVYFQFDDLNMITPIRWQAIQGESYSQIRTSGSIGTNLDKLHAAYAAKMVRNKLQQKTDWEQLFSTLAAQGRGGILVDLVGKFADAVIPGAGNVVRTVGSVIGV